MILTRICFHIFRSPKFTELVQNQSHQKWPTSFLGTYFLNILLYSNGCRLCVAGNLPILFDNDWVFIFETLLSKILWYIQSFNFSQIFRYEKSVLKVFLLIFNPLIARIFTAFGHSLSENRVLHKEAWVATLLGTHLSIQVQKMVKFSRTDISSLAVKGLN